MPITCPAIEDAMWSGDRPSQPPESRIQATIAFRRCTSSSYDLVSCQARLTRSPLVGDSNVIRSRYSGRHWKS